MLREFWLKHPTAESVLREWHTVVENTDFRDFSHVREFFNSADYAARTRFLMLRETTFDWWSSSDTALNEFMFTK